VVGTPLLVYWASVRRTEEHILEAIDASSEAVHLLILDHRDQPRAGSSVLAAASDFEGELARRGIALWVCDPRTAAHPIGMTPERVYASLDAALADAG
jgi:hypothetical protein